MAATGGQVKGKGKEGGGGVTFKCVACPSGRFSDQVSGSIVQGLS